MTTTLEVAQQYLDAWNKHDASAITAIFAVGGTYEDPMSGRVSAEQAGAYAQGLWGTFPDLSFEIESLTESGTGLVAVQWRMQGTNTGPFQGLPPTGRTISLPGADFIQVEGERIRSVRGYFDTKAVPEQLGLKVIVQPHELGPFSFGTAASVRSGKRVQPGAFGITVLWSTDEETATINDLGQAIAQDMLGMEGFIGWTGVKIGEMGVTLTAWEKPENTRQLMRGGAHGKAMQRFWSDLGHGGFTSVWTPDHYNPYWTRCRTCKKMMDYEKQAGTCVCGEPLPEPPPYF
jgi:steroid delta-isomerase-like uncharacterized protein